MLKTLRIGTSSHRFSTCTCTLKKCTKDLSDRPFVLLQLQHICSISNLYLAPLELRSPQTTAHHQKKSQLENGHLYNNIWRPYTICITMIRKQEDCNTISLSNPKELWCKKWSSDVISLCIYAIVLSFEHETTFPRWQTHHVKKLPYDVINLSE
jgi:hypothetical protein